MDQIYHTTYLWVDDERNPPEALGYDVVRTYNEAIEKLTKYQYDKVFLDHDLGDFTAGKERTGYDVLLWLTERRMNNEAVPSKVVILTANPVARERMEGVIKRYWV